MSSLFQIVVFTASENYYADPVLDYIDPKRTLISARLYRHHCSSTKHGYLKDLRIIKNRTLSDILLVDNNIFGMALQLENGIPIVAYVGDDEDAEL